MLTKGITCTAIINIANALEIPTCLLMAEKACPDYQRSLSDLAIKAFQEETAVRVAVPSRRKVNKDEAAMPEKSENPADSQHE